jgi:hypothetical protein
LFLHCNKKFNFLFYNQFQFFFKITSNRNLYFFGNSENFESGEFKKIIKKPTLVKTFKEKIHLFAWQNFFFFSLSFELFLKTILFVKK